MDKISVYSKGDDYFLLEDIGGCLLRTPLCKGKYKGTLEKSKYLPTWTYYSLDQCTLHPEYCNVAWMATNSIGYTYELVIYDKKVVTDRFLSKALTSMEDIQKVILTGYQFWFENLFTVSILDDGTKHIIYPSERYNLYKRLLEG